MKDFIDKIMKKLMTREVITYLIAGVLTTIVNLAVSYLLYDIMEMDENLVTIIAWIVAVAFAYVINNLWVFRDKYVNLKTESIKVGKFVAARLFTYVVEAIGVFIFITKLECNFWVVKFVLIVIVTILNYFFSKFLIFLNPGNEKKNDQEKIGETEQ